MKMLKSISLLALMSCIASTVAYTVHDHEGDVYGIAAENGDSYAYPEDRPMQDEGHTDRATAAATSNRKSKSRSKSSIPYPLASNPATHDDDILELLAKVLEMVIEADNQTVLNQTIANIHEHKDKHIPISPTSDAEDLIDLLGKVLEMVMAAAKEEDEWSQSDETKGNVKVSEETKRKILKKAPICREAGKAGSRQFNANCDLVKGFYVIQHHWNTKSNKNAWTIWFELKHDLLQEKTWMQRPDYFVIRSQRGDESNSTEHEETRFNLIQWKSDQKFITLDNLQAGQYAFQVCAMTSSFKPSLLDTDQFSWMKHAPAYRARLHPTPAEEKGDEKVAGDKSSSSSDSSGSGEAKSDTATF